ncbi:hypothetical protein Daus18300_003489 [Diaporthe australafricana]|uniref:Uncharacterized protein n=1 Tax=Diaporthe australafricana TaxID=127596 RepID=A0ABR3XEX1_9PEZI
MEDTESQFLSSNESSDDEVLDTEDRNDNAIWEHRCLLDLGLPNNRHGFALKDAFYAAAVFFYNTTDNQRCWVEREPNTGASTSIRGQVLDGLALFFARYKDDLEPRGKPSSKQQAKQQDEEGSPSAAHVTATAFGGLTVDEVNGKQSSFTIYIAKNGGPQNLDGIGDKECMEKLKDWYNSFVGDPSVEIPPKPTRSDEMWNYMQKTRQGSATANLRDPAHFPEPRDWGEFTQGFAGSAGEDAAFIQLRIQQDWEHLRNLLRLMDESDIKKKYEKGDTDLNEFVNHICIDDNQSWNMSYQRPPKDVEKEMSAQTCFRKLIKHFKMLKALGSLWNAFHHLAKDEKYSQAEIRFEFLPLPEEASTPEIKKGPLVEILEHWKEEVNDLVNGREDEIPGTEDRHKKSSGMAIPRTNRTRAPETKQVLLDDVERRQAIKSLEDFDTTLKNLKQGGNIFPKFHCELQLLTMAQGVDKGHRSKDPQVKDRPLYDYFGCSKLSCFTCWEVLKSQGFSTKNTHGVLYRQVAFPLLWRAPEPEKVAKCLNKITNQLVESVIDPKRKVESFRVSRISTGQASETATYGLPGIIVPIRAPSDS